MRPKGEEPLALADCSQNRAQTSNGRRVIGPGTAWHLGDDFSQLGLARNNVKFQEPRTRIAHIDTGYDREHESCPRNLLKELSCNFADGNNLPLSDQILDFIGVGDNSGHGTGTLGILAGGSVAQLGNQDLGGAPEAEILSLRIANRVVLFYSSTLARALKYAIRQRCDVVSISMGGLPSGAWNEAINEAYEAGICVVAAAGNNYDDSPTRHVVYPARYQRVLAACGVMANDQPYHDLAEKAMQGNFGPNRVMKAAMAAYTPNIPWPRFGCQHLVDLDGQGTSSATPQIAAAVALWLEKYKNRLPRNWRRVEAVRYALFESARDLD